MKHSNDIEILHANLAETGRNLAACYSDRDALHGALDELATRITSDMAADLYSAIEDESGDTYDFVRNSLLKEVI